VPTRLVPVLRRLEPKLHKVLTRTEGELRDHLQPDERDERVRLAFWDEYNHSTQCGKKMSLAAMLQGCMSWEAWVTVFEPSDKKMLWVLCPPISYQTAMRNILHVGTERLMEIMRLPIVDENGKADSKTIVNILKAFQLVDLRVKGAVMQKLQIQQQSLNVHATMNQDQVNMHMLPSSNNVPVDTLQLEDLEKLERRLDRARRDGRRLVKSMPEEDQDKYITELMEAGTTHVGDQGMKRLDGLDLDADIIITKG
jgi:hypothetical protein